MNTLIVNNRAIDYEELLDIIAQSNGIYENTLIKLLQCNRISLESRLKTLKKNKIISRGKLNKHFYYVNNYDLKHMKDLDLQAMVVQYLVTIGLYTNKIQVIDSPYKNKQLYLSVYASGKYNYKNDESIKKLANMRVNQLIHEQDRKYFAHFIVNELTKFPIRVASFSDILQEKYYTTSIDTVDILALPNKEFIPSIQSNLADVSFRNLENNSTLIRNDILIFLNDSNELCYFVKENNQYTLQAIYSVVDFFYYLTLHKNSKDAIYISDNKTEYDNADNLYFQSYLNKEKYNTVQLKKGKQKAQS
ncbi:hypothetical protein [Enterococcus hirae]|uniref:hypothetical protein n=1 Tax=Enterococcus hirae TaxID=1354 RepID=UPI000DEAA973|nr:hypothetical protein [Enterococcus hirae]RBT47921.1 hypothetical protein EB20_01740 [Enterococcus hirae]RBT49482.1 hypothetical protein EB10_02298 [Enterococcus hirae]RBT52171.1 hypothetical protein EB24_02386 [Enterococcus hirae]RBT59563.1 hypothetical protein EB39_02314 [Enterococcus hirae]